MQILLLRHGATDWNLQGRCQGATDLDLNEAGILQAEEAAAVLGRETLHAIYSSHLKRARQTAERIGHPHRLSVTIEEDIRELHHGALEGLTFDEIREIYPEFIRKWREEPAALAIPGGERLIDVDKRAWEGIERIVARHRADETLAVVSHNFPILAILCRITGTPLNRYRSFHLDPCSVTRLSYHDGNGWKVSHVNNRVYPPADSPLPRLDSRPARTDLGEHRLDGKEAARREASFPFLPPRYREK